MPERVKLLLASSNPGKLREYEALAEGRAVKLDWLENFPDLPPFREDAPTFAENAAGKALHYSQFAKDIVFADDSGLVVAALDGAPGVQSARYAGAHASDRDRIAKLLGAMRGKAGPAREARFICVVAAAQSGRLLAVFSDSAEGRVLDEPRGESGFGYDPIFFFPPRQNTFAELSSAEKNAVSHRGKAFRKLLDELTTSSPVHTF